MPTNAVYQPTTVSFENSGGSLLAQTTTSSRLKTAFRKPWRQTLLLAGGLVFLALGIVLTCVAFADYEDAIVNEETVTEMPVHEKEVDVFLIVLGVFFTIFGFAMLGKCGNVMVTNLVLRSYCALYRLVSQSRWLLASELCRVSLFVSQKARTRPTAARTKRRPDYGFESIHRSAGLAHSVRARVGSPTLGGWRRTQDANAR